MLDLSNNQLSELPIEFASFQKLRILFLSNNKFEVFPSILNSLESLDIIGFKANKISVVPEGSIPKNLRWLILTDNKIEKLPASIGNCVNLQKVMLAGNKLTELPLEMKNCKRIELLRIAANNIAELPSWLFSLPRLSWLAFSGNSTTQILKPTDPIYKFDWNTIELHEHLGQGASGNIYRAKIKDYNRDVAVKIFKGEVTSDGWPQDEMKACVLAGSHQYIMGVLGEIENHPELKQALVFDLLPAGFKNLGLPPNFITCTRDTFSVDAEFSVSTIYKIAIAMADALAHLHNKGIMHGDLYTHNILIDSSDNVLLSDFGAATIYNRSDLDLSATLEKMDVRAYGCLLEDLLLRAIDKEQIQSEVLHILKEKCLSIDQRSTPNFSTIVKTLSNF